MWQRVDVGYFGCVGVDATVDKRQSDKVVSELRFLCTHLIHARVLLPFTFIEQEPQIPRITETCSLDL